MVDASENEKGERSPVVRSLSRCNIEKAGGDAMLGEQVFRREDIRTTAFQGDRFVPLAWGAGTHFFVGWHCWLAQQ
ncbi:MAG: hypothetical protein ACC645_12440 [Pirellulales bacterium]